ncbi:unnamed protein product [Hydatigera taeniaeformis]|uniref:Uncharacterized protein n=1 Tax=Hydatigena taeniaeformis TaxID=6205 RepID=A0A0R3X7R8_HYDTA|nr:unnamed protein product [Hydatigera taeniaeformis]
MRNREEWEEGREERKEEEEEETEEDILDDEDKSAHLLEGGGRPPNPSFSADKCIKAAVAMSAFKVSVFPAQRTEVTESADERLAVLAFSTEKTLLPSLSGQSCCVSSLTHFQPPLTSSSSSSFSRWCYC